MLLVVETRPQSSAQLKGEMNKISQSTGHSSVLPTGMIQASTSGGL